MLETGLQAIRLRDAAQDNCTLPIAWVERVDSTDGVLNHRCSLGFEYGAIVVWVDGQVWLAFDSEDKAAMRLAMAQLSMHQVATQSQIASAFGVGTATVERTCRAYRSGGVEALLPKRSRGRAARLQGKGVDKAVLAARRSGQSVQAIANRLGVSRTAVNTSLARSGYRSERDQSELDLVARCSAEQKQEGGRDGVGEPAATPVATQQPEPYPVADSQVALNAEVTADTEPSDRSIDRLLARQGLLNDAAPMFEDAHRRRPKKMDRTIVLSVADPSPILASPRTRMAP